MARAKKKRKMTAATLSRLPLSAGGALAGSVARGGLWIVAAAIDGGYWLIKQFLRAPIAVSCVAAVAGFSMLAGGNALFMQTERHPAPLFFTPSAHAAPHTAPRVRPVVPAPRPHPRPVELDDETTGSVGAESAAVRGAIGNDDVLMLQKKLVALSLLSDKPDGIFGRRTATAIKVFEQKAGMRPDGRLTHELIDAVLAAPMPKPELIPAATPVAPQATPAAALAPLAKPVTTEAPVVHTLPPAPVVASGKPVPLAPLPQLARLQAAPTTPVVEKVVSAPVQPATAPVDAAPATQLAATAPVAADQPAALPSDDNGGRASSMAMNNPPAAATTTEPAVPVSPDATPAQKLAAQMGTLPPEATAGTAIPGDQPAATDAASGDTSSDPGDGAGSTDPVLITKIQRGLASLGFLGAKIDGVPGEGTAKAIRNFEVFYDYKVTGLATAQLLDLLIQHGATI
jgi:peptidoglycan hydrolase-like protein with peptidoglycan-binding domain